MKHNLSQIKFWWF